MKKMQNRNVARPNRSLLKQFNTYLVIGYISSSLHGVRDVRQKRKIISEKEPFLASFRHWIIHDKTKSIY